MQNEPVDSDLVTRAKAAKKLTQQPWAEVLGTDLGAFPSWFANRKQFGVWGRNSAGVGKLSLGRFPDGSFDPGPNADKTDGQSWMLLLQAAAIKPKRVILGVEIVACTFFGTTFIDHDGETWNDVVLDLDAVRDPEAGEWTPYARDTIEEAQSLGAWCEISPSKTGAKIFGKLPADGESNKLTLNLPDGSTVEVFIGRKAHLCLTGVPCDPDAKAGDSLPDLSHLVKRLEAAAVGKPGASNAQPAKAVPQGGGGGDSHGRSVPRWFNDEADLWGLMSADGWTKGKPASRGGWLVTRPAKGQGKGCSGVLTADGKRLINWSSNANVTEDSQGYDSFAYWCYQRRWDCSDRQVLKTVEGWLKTGPIGSPPTVIDSDFVAVPLAAPQALPWKPFPVECLPDVLRAFVEGMASAFGVDPGWIAPACLTVLGGSIGRSRVIRVKPGWNEVPSLWLALVGESGTKKSPILNRVVRPLWAIHKRLVEEFAQAMRKHLALEELCNHKLEKATRDAAKNGGAIPDGLEELPVKPLEIRCMVSNATVQKLTAILAENPRGVLASYDELQTWFDSLGRFAQKNGNELAAWLPMDSGQALMADTLARGTVFVEHAFCAILGGIQPGLLKARFADSGFLDSGGAARFCLVEPPRTVPVWNEHGVPREVDDRWDRLIEGLLGLKMEERNPGELVPYEIFIGDKGKKVWVAWYEAHAKAMGAATGHWGSFLSKMEGKAARLALVLCMADRVSKGWADDLSQIEAVWIEAGCLLADWFIQERGRIEAGWKRMGSGKPTIADKISAALRAAGPAGLTKSELWAKVGGATPKSDLDGALDALAKQGLAILEAEPSGGRVGERWRAAVYCPSGAGLNS